MRIGEVAQQSGTTIKTIRFYCQQGLLQSPERSEGGYRLFDTSIFAELDLIRTLKYIDAPLEQIRQLLQSRRSGFCHCNELKLNLAHKVDSLDDRIKELQQMRATLQDLLDGWQECGGIKQHDDQRSLAD